MLTMGWLQRLYGHAPPDVPGKKWRQYESTPRSSHCKKQPATLLLLWQNAPRPEALGGLGLSAWHSLPDCPGKFSNPCGVGAGRGTATVTPRVEVALHTALTLGVEVGWRTRLPGQGTRVQGCLPGVEGPKIGGTGPRLPGRGVRVPKLGGMGPRLPHRRYKVARSLRVHLQ